MLVVKGLVTRLIHNITFLALGVSNQGSKTDVICTIEYR